MGSYFSIVVAHTLKMTVQKYWTIISPQMKSLRRITWFFFSISGSLLAYLRCIYITSCFPPKISMLSKQCARVSWFVLITFIINEVFYIDRTTNLSPWSCNVAMVALIVKQNKPSLITVLWAFNFWTSISRRQTGKCRSYNPSKRIGFSK